MPPTDGHVHTEWSWDCEPVDKEASRARALAVGLPAIAFTEHLDFSVWTNGEPAPASTGRRWLYGVRAALPGEIPDLVILTGVEVGEPHWHRDQVAAVLAAGQFDRVLGSLRTLPLGAGLNEPGERFARRPAAEVVRDYLAETARLVAGSMDFEALAHIDFVSRC